MPDAPPAETPKLRSKRRQLSEALTKIWRELRNGDYFVRRGGIEWATFDFNAHPLAVSIMLPNFPVLVPNGRGIMEFEILQRARNWQAEQKDIDDESLDDLWDDVSEAIKRLLLVRLDEDQTVPVILHVTESAPATEAANVEQLGVQGLTVKIEFDF
jgi:hypothetical protein